MQATAATPKPFKQSWMDSFFDRVERLPISKTFFYILAYILFNLLHHALLWADGSLPLYQFERAVFLNNIWFIFIAAAWHFLRINISDALTRFEPALELSEIQYKELYHRTTRLSARIGWLFTFSLIAFIPFMIPSYGAYLGEYFYSGYSRYLVLISSLFIFPMNFGFFYMVFHTLASITRIYRIVHKINLFNLSPLYSFSTYTARVGMLFIVFVLINQISGQLLRGENDPVTTFYTVLQGGMAILVFILPLWGIHQRLAEEKAYVSEENNSRVERSFWELQRRIDTGELDGIGDLRNSIAALMDFREEIKKIPTWPWDPGTLRSFLTALLMPLTIWGLQQFVLRQFIP